MEVNLSIQQTVCLSIGKVCVAGTATNSKAVVQEAEMLMSWELLSAEIKVGVATHIPSIRSSRRIFQVTLSEVISAPDHSDGNLHRSIIIT